MKWNGAQVVFTGYTDGKIRVFKIKEDNSGFEKQLEHPTPNAYVNKFTLSGEQYIICALSNGKYLGWNLSSNSFDDCPGHESAEIVALTKY